MIDAIGVAIPARDEAASIDRCLTSIAAAAAEIAVPVMVVVAADACGDDTIDVATATAARSGLDIDVVACRCGSAGAARRFGGARVAERLAMLGLPEERTWVATTDADTTVPVDWFVRQLAWAAQGVDGVAGLVDLGAGASEELRQRFDLATAAAGGRGPGHAHVHGANLGIRGSVLWAAGGFPDVALGEDHELWARLAGLPARLLGVADTTVVTSARLISQTVGGFATFLAALATET